MSAVALDTPQTRRWGLLALVLGVLALLGFYTVTDPARLAINAPLDGLDYVGYAFCHRITERSFTIGGRQMALCARCTGMYLGFAAVFVLLGLAGRWRWTELPRLPVLLSLLGLIGLMGVDGINSYSHFFPNAPHLYEPQNWLRLATGLGTGLALGGILVPALGQTLWYEQTVRPAIGTMKELGGILLLAAVLGLLVLSNQPTLLYVLGVASALGLLTIVTSLNTMVLLIVTRRDAAATSWRQAAVPLLTGLALAIVEIAIVGVVRFQLTGTLTGLPGL